MTQIKIQDESGDKKYFTLLPNYILNHSTAKDQALYMQIKRYAGEEGECFASEKLLCKKLGIGKKALKNSLDYLLKHNWIKFIGLKQISTKGGMQPIKVYSVVDIWQQNSDYFKGVSKISPLTDRGVSERVGGGVQNNAKGVSERAIEEEQGIKKNNKEELATAVAEPINKFIELFKEVNPSYKQLYKDATQRACLKRLLKLMGSEKLENCINTLSKTNGMEFAPVITTPYLLEKKLGNLIAFVKKQGINKNKTLII